MLSHVFLGMALAAIGSRCWGAAEEKVFGITVGTRPQGVLLMTIGCVIAAPQFALWSPLLFGLIWLFRLFETGETWLAFQRGRNRTLALLRSWPLWLIAAVFTLIDEQDGRMIVAMLFPLTAYAYRWGGMIDMKNGAEIGELFLGAFIALLAATAFSIPS